MDIYTIAKTYLNKHKNYDRIVFFEGNYNNIFNEKNLKEKINEFNEFNYIYFQFKPEFQSAYCPFMDFIRDIYIEKYSKKISAYDFACMCNVYEMQKVTIATFLESKIAERKEYIILGEAIYEEERFIESIINIIKFITKDIKINIFLDSFQFATSSTVKLINKIVEENSKCPIKNFTLVIYSISEPKIPQYNKEYWEEMINNSKKNNLLDFIPSTNNVNNLNIPINKKRNMTMELICEHLFEITNLINMLAMSQAKFYLEYIYNQLSINNNLKKMNNKHLKFLFEKMIIVNIYEKYSSNLISIHKKDYSYINFLCEKLKECCSSDDEYTYFKYNSLLCTINHINNKQHIAYEYYLKCLNYAKKHKNSHLKFSANYVHYFFLCYDKNQNNRRKTKITKEEIEFCKKLYKHKHFNTLIYMYLYNYECDDETIDKISCGKENFVYLEKALDIAKSIDNRYFLNLVYGRKATFFTSPKINNYLFKKDIDMQKTLRNDIEIPKYSFIAYKYTMSEEYNLSHETNLELIDILYDKIRNGSVQKNISSNENSMELLLALYNMATNCICAEEYTYALKYLDIVCQEMKLLNCFDLSMCDLSKIYAMEAYCYYKTNSTYKCSMILDHFKNLLSFAFTNENELITKKSNIARNDSMFLYYVTHCLLNLDNGILDSCEIELKKACKYYKNENAQEVFMLPILSEAQYKLYKKLGNDEKALDSINNCIKFCSDNNLKNLKKRMEKFIGISDYSKASYNFNLKNITETDIISLLKTKRLESNVINYSNNITYLKLWNNKINEIKNTYSTIFENCIELISNYLGTRNILYLTLCDKENDYKFFKQEFNLKNKYIYAYNVNDNIKLNNNKIIEMVKYFKKNTNPIFLKRTDRSFFDNKFISDVINKDMTVTFIAIPTFRNSILESIFVAYTSVEETGIINNNLIDKGKLTTLLIMLSQLSDIEKLYDVRSELLKAIDRANTANKAKSDFLANMSHEIRTPLNTILGMNEMILRESSEENILNYSNHINSSGNTLLSLINEILDFSKIESGKMDLIIVTYNFKDLITDVYNMVSNRAQKKSLKLIFNVDKNIPAKLLGDDIKIKQILVNILTNAIKYTNEGSVTLDINITSAHYDYISINFSINDTGIGIKENAIKELFQSFTRLDLEKTRNIEGTGLGLTITQKLLKMMNSTLNVESIYGKGSKFYFTLNQKIIDKTPIKTLDLFNSDNKKNRKINSYIAPNAKILVVDDNDMNRIVIKQLLKSSKIQITTASSGFECLDYAAKEKYNIIFLDHMMPEMDGIETLKKLKSMDNNLNINTPIIVLTANAISGAKEMYLKNGFNNYLSKPLNSENLDNMIMKYLPSELIIENEQATENIISTDKQDFPSIPGINVYEAMKYNNSNKSFLEMLTVFYNTIEDKSNIIENLEKSENTKDYTTYVHALKSSSKLIGATMLSEIAMELEKAGNEGDISKIHAETPFLLNLYRRYLVTLKPYVKTNEESLKTLINNDFLKESLHNIFKSIDDFDLDSAEKIMKNINNYTVKDSLKDDISSLNKYIQSYNAEEILSLIPKIINKIK